jgi:hypothetical protein
VLALIDHGIGTREGSPPKAADSGSLVRFQLCYVGFSNEQYTSLSKPKNPVLWPSLNFRDMQVMTIPSMVSETMLKRLPLYLYICRAVLSGDERI